MDRVQHFEIPADETQRARRFYEGCFGWKTTEWPMPGGEPYIGIHTGPVNDQCMCEEPGYINGGMFRRTSQMPVKGPTIAVVVANIDSSLAQIKAAGGSVVMEKTPVGDVGLYAYIRDTEGNVIGVWQDLKKKS